MTTPKRISRVFIAKTSMTPDDGLAFIDCPPPMLTLPEIDEVHISVTFTWDLKRAEQLAEAWKVVGVPVLMGGPATGQPGGEFVPGMYVKKGYTITSRGCPNHCWFCSVPGREGGLTELPIRDGWNILDDNILACSDGHIKAVFEMLSRQDRKPEFTGGLEAKILKPWHAAELRKVGAKHMYFAYDTKDDYEPLIRAGKIMRDEGHTVAAQSMRCYVLIGYPGDTATAAEARLTDTIKAGFMPYAMLYRAEGGRVTPEWERFQREWLRPQIVGAKMREIWTAEGTTRPRQRLLKWKRLI